VADVDFLHRRVEVRRNAVTVGSTAILGTPKTGKTRTVIVPRIVCEALSPSCQGKGPGDLLWKTAAGGPLTTLRGERNWLAGAVARCQAADPTFPRVTAHDLRHTAASLAISSGANVKAVQRMLGHSSAAMTLDVYADLFDSDLGAVADRLDEMWARRG
jgi:integrase